MKHLGDITKISGRDIDPVDCITFGSPCQDLSQAGKRAGLDGERSGLFIHAVRIIKEMRENTNGRYPTFAIWENVPGAFSSNKGEDFRTVLEQLARIKEADVTIPRPEKNKWAKAGIICGDGYSIAWRTFDAQYWGVPQRRRRIAVVVDFTGQCAGEILFESKGVPGYTEPRIQTWKEAAGNLGNSIALPQWWWITCKMANYLPQSATLGSLFDGIGGFPLVWETRHGKGTAVWASEIEEFPIAVTKKWFA